jgi:transcriptional regulator of heat shock response
MAKAELDNYSLQLKSNVLFETLKQHRKILQSHLSSKAKVNLLSTNFEQLFNRITDFCDSLTEYSKELEDVISETYRSHDIVTAP